MKELFIEVFLCDTYTQNIMLAVANVPGCMRGIEKSSSHSVLATLYFAWVTMNLIKVDDHKLVLAV